MEPRLYNRLLIRLLALPIAALAALAFLLAVGLQQLQQSANAVDHSDLVILHANRLIKLMVDEETGLRGYLLVRNPIFLDPMRAADKEIGGEFDTLFSVLRSPDQIDRLRKIQASHQEWERTANEEIHSPPQLPGLLEQHMFKRKQDMDDLRAQMDQFLDVVTVRRAEHSAVDARINRYAPTILVFLITIVALLLVWYTRKLFLQLTSTYNRQLDELHRRTEESYAREQWLNTTLRSIGDAVIACDVDGNVVFMNLIAQQLTGWKEDEARGLSLHKVFPIFNEETRAPVENPVDKVRRLGTVVGLANHTFLVSRGGKEICIDDSGAPIRDTGGDIIGIVLVFRDITDRRLSEGALMRAEKLAAAGRLAASVAHEVNNPLEGLTNLVYIARRSDDFEEIHQLLDQAEAELARIAHITRQSLGFYRETTFPALFRPSTIVREVAEFYASRASTLGVGFVLNTTTDREVFGSAGELRQILSNLITNSLDACAKGATIRIEANAATDPRAPSRPGVRISVADTGLGIRPEHLSSIFEPFFTTKKDTGTGLGLWVSRELVEKHGGRLRVRSSVRQTGSGTVFSIFLPQQTPPQPENSIPPTSNTTNSTH